MNTTRELEVTSLGMRILFIANLLLAHACAYPHVVSSGAKSGAPPFKPPVLRTSGKRLQVIELLTEEGLRDYGPWRDRQLETVCEFVSAEDGKERCLPRGPFTQLFADETCQTQPLFPVQETCSEGFGRFASEPRRVRVVRIGSHAAADRVFVRENGGKLCRPVPELAGRLFARSIEALPAARFVAVANTGPADSDRRVSELFKTMDDGARERAGLFDNELQTRCMMMFAEDGRRRCLPYAPVAHYRAYSDPACTKRLDAIRPLFQDLPGGGYFPSTVARRLGPGKVHHRVYRGVQILIPIYVQDSQKGCERDEGRLVSFARHRDPIPPEKFVAFSPAGEEAGRLHREWYVTSEGVMEDSGITDTQMARQECRFYRTDDDTWRCLPGFYGVTNLFEDPGCTRRLVRSASDSGILTFGATRSEPICRGQYRIHQLGPPLTQVFEQHTDLTCRAKNVSFKIYGQGAAVDPGRFEAAVEEVR